MKQYEKGGRRKKKTLDIHRSRSRVLYVILQSKKAIAKKSQQNNIKTKFNKRMKTERPIWSRSRRCMLAAGVLLVAGAMTSCQDYDLDKTSPEGWERSIYSWLEEEGKYTNTVRLINDLGYREVLDKTGSKTFFVADDAAYERFFQKNGWGVHSYDQLSLPQKKLLLSGSMIDNSIQLSNLSNVNGNPPREGEAMRRYSAINVLDSVSVIYPEKMPDNPYWKPYRDAGKPIVCLTDGTVVPVVQFIEKQLLNKRITNDDYNFIFNKTTNRQAGDASVNGVQVAEPNIRCSNGFVHRMAEVATPLPNMAELIASKPQVSTFNRLMERFCGVYAYDPTEAKDPYARLRDLREQYNYYYNTNVDTVYEKRFFSEKSQKGRELVTASNRKPAPALLKFDPEWNAYFSGNSDVGEEVAMQRDMAVIMVPSNAAMEEYWQNGAGRVLKDNYGTWDNVPDDVISKLINNNMLASFVASVPSKFNGITNDANDPMGVEASAIDSVWLGCNGAVYLTNRVYSPTAYVSVSFPTLINESMKVLGWGIEQNQYHVYLNALKTYYSFFVPTNGGLLEYIDPCSYGKTKTQLFRFFYDKEAPSVRERVWASLWNIDLATGERDSLTEIRNYDVIKNRLKDILDTHIVIGNVEDGNTYYRTKGGTEVHVQNVSAGANGMTVEGSYQLNEGQPVPVSYIYDQTDGGNGKSYILNREPIMGTRQTVRDILAGHTEFSKFLELMDGSPLFEQKHEKHLCGGTNISVFNTYHYTIYVPTNASIQQLQDEGKLPSWDIVEQKKTAGNVSGAESDSIAIVDFLKYHIQDNALYIGAAKETGDFETARINAKTNRFHRLRAELTSSGIVLKDEVDLKNNTSHKVLTSDPALYNLMAREYQYDTEEFRDLKDPGQIYTSSSAVVHLIDRPLLIEK